MTRLKMKNIKIVVLILLFCLSMNSLFSQNLTQEQQNMIASFIDEVKNNDTAKIADRIRQYPYRRNDPLPDVKSRDEFIEHYKEIFDDYLRELIIKSNPTTDWKDMGWRGIMLNNGIVWIDNDGYLRTINYETAAEKELRKQLIEEERNQLYPSIRNYEQPLYILETKKERVRIDDLGNGSYRYVSWPKRKKMNQKPEKVLVGGKCTYEGNGGNHYYLFTDGEVAYKCYIYVMQGSSTPPATIGKYENEKLIYEHEANIIRK